jgi:hypothetical protein
MSRAGSEYSKVLERNLRNRDLQSWDQLYQSVRNSFGFTEYE